MADIDFELDMGDEPQQPSGQSLIPSADTASDQKELVQARMFEWIGQRKFSAALQKLLTVSDLVELQKLKESKAYKGLKLVIDGKLTDVSSFKQVCDSIGVSEQHISEQLLNLKTFGPEFVEYSDKYMGFRDVRALRKLPDDEREALIEVAKAGDKDQLLDLAESLIVKHSKEKAELQSDNESLIDQIENHKSAWDDLHNKHETLERNYQRLTKAKQPGESAYNARTVEVRQEAAALEYASRVNVDALDVIYGEVINDSETSHQERELQLHAIAIAAGGLLARAELLYARIKDDLGDLLPIKTNASYLLRDDEKARLQDSVTMIDINFTRGKNKRDIERSAERPGPGRKKGSTNKKGGGDVSAD